MKNIAKHNYFALKSRAQQLLSSTLFLYEYCSRGYTMLLHQTRNVRNIKLT